MPGGAPPPVIAAQIASSSWARSGSARAVERGEQLQSGTVIGIEVALLEGH